MLDRERDLESALWSIVDRCHEMRAALRAAEDEIGDDWYVGGGCVAQLVWNALTGGPPLHGVEDIDVAYFDRRDSTAEAEDAVRRRLRAAFDRHLGSVDESRSVRLDVKNQARVHEWYEARFGVPLQPFGSVEAAVATWPTTATCVGIRRTERGSSVFAPYGLRDVFGMVVRPNKALVTRAVFEAKVERWRRCWPDLTVTGW